MADEATERRFLDDVPLEILEPVAPEVYDVDPNPWARHRPAPPIGPSPLGPVGIGELTAPLAAHAPAWDRAPRPMPAPLPAPMSVPMPGHAGRHPYAAPYAAHRAPAAAPRPLPAPGPMPAPGQMPAPRAAGRPTNVMAIVALALSLVGFAPLGLALGLAALGEIRRSGEEGREMALAAVWVGGGMTILAALAVALSLVLVGGVTIFGLLMMLVYGA